ncbi:MAG: ATP-dependent helicase, partial [bacterium]|nr:ATP-dependent helicase [bacterium]
MTRRSAVDIAEAVQRDRPRSEWIIPTAEQVAAIEAPLTPTLVVAGAGSGKTATMADRVVWLVVNELAAPEEILGLTFTRKAAGELAERVRRNLRRAREAGLISGELGDVATPTYNSFAASVVRDHALRIGRDPDAALVTRAGEWQLISEVVEGWQGPLELGGALSTIKSNALTLAEELRSHLVGVDEVREFTNRILPEVELISQAGTTKKSREAAIRAAESLRNRLELLRIVEVFYALMRERGLVTFSDQVGMACEIAATVPAVGALFRSQYRSVLLDEFQDTSVAQLTFLHDLFGSGFPAMAVGDPNQAIYGWRGASASSLVSFAEMFAAEDQPTVVLPLSVSWRNDSAILRAANITAAPLADEEGAGRLLTELRERPGVSEGEVHRSVALTEPEEASEIARWVAERWTPGVVSAAVLCRGGNQFPSLIRAFRELGIEPEVVGLKGLLNTPEVADIRAALEVVADSSRGDAMMRLLTNERLGLADLHVLGEWAVSLAGGAARGDADVSAAVVEAVDSLPPTDFVTKGGNRLSPEGRRRVERLREQIREIRRSLAYPLPDLVSAAERALLLDIEVAARPGISPAAARRNLDHFAAHVSSYAAGSAAPTLGGLLEWLTSADEAEAGLDAAPDAAHSEAVQILTMHGAKGLEWDVVAVAGMTEGTFPHRRNNAGRLAERETGWIRSAAMIPGPLRGDARHLPTLEEGATTPAEFTEGVERFEGELFEHSILEERRLAYVAITRARHQVLLSGSHFRSGKKPLPLSRFLTELEGASVVPSGFSVVAPPDPDSEPAEEVAGEPVTYPAADPWPQIP